MLQLKDLVALGLKIRKSEIMKLAVGLLIGLN